VDYVMMMMMMMMMKKIQRQLRGGTRENAETHTQHQHLKQCWHRYYSLFS